MAREFISEAILKEEHIFMELVGAVVGLLHRSASELSVLEYSRFDSP